MNGKTLKWLGIGVSAVATVLSFAGDVIGKKQQEETIAKEVAKAIAKTADKES